MNTDLFQVLFPADADVDLARRRELLSGGGCEGSLVLIRETVAVPADLVAFHYAKEFVAPDSACCFVSFKHSFDSFSVTAKKLGLPIDAMTTSEAFAFVDASGFQTCIPNPDAPPCVSFAPAVSREVYVADAIAAKEGVKTWFAQLVEHCRSRLETLCKGQKRPTALVIDGINAALAPCRGLEGMRTSMELFSLLRHLSTSLHCTVAVTATTSDDTKCDVDVPEIGNTDPVRRWIALYEGAADVVISVHELPTGHASDVHGRIVLLAGTSTHPSATVMDKDRVFLFRRGDHRVEYFAPGTRV